MSQNNELQTLIRMANQIAANFSFHSDAVEKTTAHLQRFWAPSMKEMILAHVAEGGSGLDDIALQATHRLAV